ncbi:unnamed protein product [Candidula unifasciata]|uniref:Uncharacterized protein n=1 Tax=Candidula unifasciata TaxID=100452 RepID=A0A8S3ZG27_9EUPU|nr:unnamed protein product [Candidula unifasciata]
MVKRINPEFRFLLLVFSVAFLTDTCWGQNNVPLTQNLSFAAIRLWSDSPNTINQGRVDLQMSNEVWGSICPASWNESVTAIIVNTICAMLGFMNGGKRVPNTFGAGNKNFIIENATCPVNATSLYQCTQYFLKKCGPQDQELAVECVPDPRGSNFVQLAKPSPVQGSGGLSWNRAAVNTVILNGTNTTNCVASPNARLFSGDVVNSSVGNGFVQVKINDQWGFVCTDTWNQAAAIVVCRELCYESVPGFTPLPGVIAKSVPDQLNRTFALSSVNCVGTESSLLACPVVNSSAVCSPSTVLAGVQCRPDCCEDKPIVMPYMNCSTEVLIANFTKDRFPMITVNNIFLVNYVPSQCMNVTSNQAGDVLVNVSVASGCGVNLQENSTHITYAVSVRAIWVSGSVVINAYSNVRYDLVCSLPKVYVVTNRMEPYTKAPNVTLYQQYNFSMSLDLFTDCNFTTAVGALGSVYLVEVGQWLNAAIAVDNYDPRTKLVLTDCDAYPVIPYTAYTPVVKLIQDKCPVNPTLTMYSLDNRREGFQVRAFLFAGYSMVYIRCSINICLLNSTSAECDRSCQNPLLGRRKRSANILGSVSVDTKTIFLYNASDPGASKILQMLSPKAQPGSEDAEASNQNKALVENNEEQVTADNQITHLTTDTKTATTATQQTRTSTLSILKKTTTAIPSTRSYTSEKVTPTTATNTPRNQQDVKNQDQELNESELQQYEDPRQNHPLQEQERQPAGLEANSSSPNVAQRGIVSELKGDNPDGASCLIGSRAISIVICAVWLVYLLTGAQHFNI